MDRGGKALGSQGGSTIRVSREGWKGKANESAQGWGLYLLMR